MCFDDQGQGFAVVWCCLMFGRSDGFKPILAMISILLTRECCVGRLVALGCMVMCFLSVPSRFDNGICFVSVAGWIFLLGVF